MALLEAELRRTEDRFASVPSTDGQAIDQVQAAYLSLSARFGRQSAAVCCRHSRRKSREPNLQRRAAYQSSLLRIHAIVEGWTGSSDKAWALIAQNVGAVMLARAMRDEEEQRDLLESVRREGQALRRGADEG